ncbi:MAG: putative 4-hydroxybenzoate polyprenyltransferase [Archaeoglobaceae archaeon]|nr:putative 4-hydroxybenzoate polyprenyltransferase [Archaeoglobaceae archaeon]MCX8152432.1 putative 4-hydroxybenzoate polyprenyltransferase [Archaeoglobaceae archaeon]MDW8013772.1 4-hydroxybenzoate octaprenyltransferase [Archaeoglobaceae archaeon]
MKIKIYMEFIKIEHTLFALPFAYSGAILGGNLDLKTTILILIAFTSLRAAAMSWNRIVDKDIDAKNPRTAKRHIPAGLISLREAYYITLVSALIYFLSALMINRTAALLSPIPLAISLIYPYLKRYTCLCHYVLGLNLALAPLGGFIAVTDSINFSYKVLFLSFGVLFWVSGFDIIYSIQDLEFDRREKLHSLPAHFGENLALQISLLNHLFFIFIILFVFSFTALLIALLIALEHFIVHFKRDKIEYAFFHLNVVISVLLFASILVDSSLL